MTVTPSVLTFTEVSQAIAYNVEFSTQLAGKMVHFHRDNLDGFLIRILYKVS